MKEENGEKRRSKKSKRRRKKKGEEKWVEVNGRKEKGGWKKAKERV